jgi:hypothetical protein
LIGLSFATRSARCCTPSIVSSVNTRALPTSSSKKRAASAVSSSS